MECKRCKRKFASEKGVKIHMAKSKVCLAENKTSIVKETPKFIYFDYLLPELKLECLDYLDPKDMYSCYRTRMDIFSVKYNDYWKLRCKKIYFKRNIRPVSWSLTYIKMLNKLCFDCMKPTSCINNFFNIPVCISCQKDNRNLRTVALTTVKNEYLLTSGDIKDLEYRKVPNPYYRTAPEMILYLKSDIEALAEKKHNGKLEDLKKEKEIKKKNRRNNKEQLIEKRRNELKEAMSKKKLKIRSDSRLCDNYINGTLNKEWTLDDVVDMCCEMHWLYNYTNYKKRLDKELSEEINFYKEWGERYHFPTVYEDVESDIREEIIEDNGGYPNIWPWLKKN